MTVHTHYVYTPTLHALLPILSDLPTSGNIYTTLFRAFEKCQFLLQKSTRAPKTNHKNKGAKTKMWIEQFLSSTDHK